MLMMTNHESDEHWPLQCHDVTLWCQSREMFCSPMDQEWSVETSLTSPRHKVLLLGGTHLLLTFKILHLAGLRRHHWRQYCDHRRHHAWTGQGQSRLLSTVFLRHFYYISTIFLQCLHYISTISLLYFYYISTTSVTAGETSLVGRDRNPNCGGLGRNFLEEHSISVKG